MAEIKDPKRFYYAMRSKYAREVRQISQKHMFVTTEEDDALQWEKYNKVMKRWRALKKPEGVEHAEDDTFQEHWRWKPVYNEEYAALTLQMKELQSQLNQAKSKQERYAIDDKIRALRKKRRTVTTFTDRLTGESKPEAKG